MTKKYFGTDGIRGAINSENINNLYGIQVEVNNNNGIWNIKRLIK